MSIREKILQTYARADVAATALRRRELRPPLPNDNDTCVIIHRESPRHEWEFQSYTASRTVAILSAWFCLRQERDVLGHAKFECVAILALPWDENQSKLKVKPTPEFEAYLREICPAGNAGTKPSGPEAPLPRRKSSNERSDDAPIAATVQIPAPQRKTQIIPNPQRKVSV